MNELHKSLDRTLAMAGNKLANDLSLLRVSEKKINKLRNIFSLSPNVPNGDLLSLADGINKALDDVSSMSLEPYRCVLRVIKDCKYVLRQFDVLVKQAVPSSLGEPQLPIQQQPTHNVLSSMNCDVSSPVGIKPKAADVAKPVQPEPASVKNTKPKVGVPDEPKKSKSLVVIVPLEKATLMEGSRKRGLPNSVSENPAADNVKKPSFSKNRIRPSCVSSTSGVPGPSTNDALEPSILRTEVVEVSEESLQSDSRRRLTRPSAAPVASSSSKVHQKGVRTLKRRHIRKLEKNLDDIAQKIKELQQSELTLDDMNSETSAYCNGEKLERKFIKVYNYLCKHQGAVPLTKRPTDKLLTYTASGDSRIDNEINRFLRKREFPDYTNIRDCFVKANNEHSLGLSARTIEDRAIKAFKAIGHHLQRRRVHDFKANFGCELTDKVNIGSDPALKDVELNEKLKRSFELGEHNMEKLLDMYTEKQEEQRLAGNEDNDADDDDDEDAEKSEDDEEEEGDDDIDALIEDGSEDEDSKNSEKVVDDGAVEDDAEKMTVDKPENQQKSDRQVEKKTEEQLKRKENEETLSEQPSSQSGAKAKKSEEEEEEEKLVSRNGLEQNKQPEEVCANQSASTMSTISDRSRLVICESFSSISTEIPATLVKLPDPMLGCPSDALSAMSSISKDATPTPSTTLLANNTLSPPKLAVSQQLCLFEDMDIDGDVN